MSMLYLLVTLLLNIEQHRILVLSFHQTYAASVIISGVLIPWTLNGETIKVVDKNEHLGLVVAGVDEEQRNIDENISKCRTSLFALLGPAFAYRCLLSPVVQVHLWRACSLPVLLSGLSALPIRPTNVASLEIFHNKIMRGFLKLSKSSPIPALHFLLGELPAEGILHIRTLCLIHNIWRTQTALSMTWSPTY